MALMVFSVALSADVAHFQSALQKPGLLARSLFAMYVVMPLVAILIAASFEFSHALKAALVLLALSPVPPLLPKRQIKVGGSESYVLGLLVAAALAAIVVVPAGVTLIGRAFGQDFDALGVTTKVVARSVLLPLVAGLIVARLAPRFAKKAAKPIGIASVMLLVASLVPVVFAARHLLFAQIGNFTILAIVLFAVFGPLRATCWAARIWETARRSPWRLRPGIRALHSRSFMFWRRATSALQPLFSSTCSSAAS